jgi:hypothetical protein
LALGKQLPYRPKVLARARQQRGAGMQQLAKARRLGQTSLHEQRLALGDALSYPDLHREKSRRERELAMARPLGVPLIQGLREESLHQRPSQRLCQLTHW